MNDSRLYRITVFITVALLTVFGIGIIVFCTYGVWFQLFSVVGVTSIAPPLFWMVYSWLTQYRFRRRAHDGLMLPSVRGMLLPRRTQQMIDDSVLSTIESVARLNVPLSTGIQLASESEPEPARYKLRRIAMWLSKGLSLSEAIRLGHHRCPALAISIISASEKSGQTTAGLKQAKNWLDQRRDAMRNTWGSLLPYAGLLLLVQASIVLLLMVMVVPKYEEIFRDFSTRLPAGTCTLINTTSFFFSSTGQVTLPIACVCAFSAVYLSLRPRRTPELAITSKIADWVRWHTPGWRQIESGQGMAMMLRTLQASLKAGMDIAQASHLAATLDVNWLLRKRMMAFHEMLITGTELRTACRSAGLGEVTGIALSGGANGPNMCRSLEYAAEYYESLVGRCWRVIANLAWPVGTLMMATLIGLVVLAMYQPLIALIDSTLQGTGY